MKRESKPSRVSTPWGVSDYCYHYGPGVICYNTPGHGGFHLSATRRAEMPVGLRSFVGYGGEGWYEEDCDWCVVALSFPTLFEPQDVWAAVRTAMTFTGPYGAEVKEWLCSPAGAAVRAIAEGHQAENAQKFTRGCEGTDGKGWFVSARTMDGTREVTFWFPNVPLLPRPFSYAEAIAAGAVDRTTPPVATVTREAAEAFGMAGLPNVRVVG